MAQQTHLPRQRLVNNASAIQARETISTRQTAHATQQAPTFQLRASSQEAILQRQAAHKNKMYWIPFKEGGMWDGKKILSNMKHPPIILRTAILYGPEVVFNLGKNLLKRLKETEASGTKAASKTQIEIRDIMRNIHYGIQGGARPGGSSTLTVYDLEHLGDIARQLDDTHKINFDKDGSWDALSILDGLTQEEKEITRIPQGLPDRGSESDYFRCGAQALMASTIIKGPEAVLNLGKNVLLTIKNTLNSPIFPPFIHTLATDQVKYVMREISKGMKEKSGGNFSHLTQEDFSYLAHWLYIYTFNPEDAGRKQPSEDGEAVDEIGGYRTVNEIAEAANISGYDNLGTWIKINTNQELMDKAQALEPGNSFIVIISSDPESKDLSTYYHTIMYFKDPKSDKTGVYNPSTGEVEMDGDGWYEFMIDEHFEDPSFLKPLALERSISLPKASELPENNFPWPTGSRVEFYDDFMSKSH